MCQESAPEGAVGRRLAVQRKLAGLTQQQLAARAHVSTSLVSQVEQGAVPASPAFTAAVARALGIDVEALTGEPYGSLITDPKAEHAGIPALRAALDNEEDPDFEGFPMPASELRNRLDQCDQDGTRSRYTQMATALPELLQHAYAIVNTAPSGQEAQTAWALLDDAYACAHIVAYRFGYVDLAALATERRRQTIERVGDPLRAAASVNQHVYLRLRRGDYPSALRLMEGAQVGITDERGLSADSVRTHLHLLQAITHARSGAADRADEHITAARELVARGVPVHPYYGVRASAANVDIHWVRVPVEMSDGTTAVGRAERVRIPDSTEPTRAGHYWIDVARAWTLHGDRVKALGSLDKARAVAPQLTRGHPSVRETVHLLAEHDRRATDSLAGFARWLGVTL